MSSHKVEIFARWDEEQKGSSPDLESAIAALRRPLNAVLAACEEYTARNQSQLDAPFNMPTFSPAELDMMHRRPRCARSSRP